MLPDLECGGDVRRDRGLADAGTCSRDDDARNHRVDEVGRAPDGTVPRS
jgi:hypothetical protein